MASIVKRGNSFCVVYSYTSENGERKQKWETFHNNEDALKRKKEIEYKQSIGKFKAPSCTTLDDLLAEYVELYGKNKWAMMSYGNNTSLINHYISPIIGSLKLYEITPHLLERYYQALQRTPSVHRITDPKYEVKYIKIPTIQKIHKLLSSAFNQAVKWGIIESNPVKRAEMPTYKKTKRAIWDSSTLMLVNQVCKDDRLKLCINLAFACSLRIGELLALTWDCVDVSKESIKNGTAYVYVKKEIQRISKSVLQELNNKDVIYVFPAGKDSGQTVLALKLPKTASSIRKVFLPKAVAEMLIAHKKEQDFVREALGEEYHDYNLVIASSIGTPIDTAKIASGFNKLIRDYNLPKVVFHSLRHSSITYKLQLNGGDIKSVQGDSGHAEARMVTDQYAHILDENRRKLAQLMEENFYQKMDSFTADDPNTESESKKTNDSTIAPEQIAEILANPGLRDLLIKLGKSIEKGSEI